MDTLWSCKSSTPFRFHWAHIGQWYILYESQSIIFKMLCSKYSSAPYLFLVKIIRLFTSVDLTQHTNQDVIQFTAADIGREQHSANLIENIVHGTTVLGLPPPCTFEAHRMRMFWGILKRTTFTQAGSNLGTIPIFRMRSSRSIPVSYSFALWHVEMTWKKVASPSSMPPIHIQRSMWVILHEASKRWIVNKYK
jgi:hypothetical protein